MDALAGLLEGPRARGAWLLRMILDPPWAVRIEDRAPLTLVTMMRGESWATLPGREPVRLRVGDVALFRGPDPYVVGDDPATAPVGVVRTDGLLYDFDGRQLCDDMALGVRTWGTSPDGASAMHIGTYQMRGEISRRLLDALPPLAVVSGEESDRPLVRLLGEEIVRDEPGQAVFLDRLLDLTLIDTLRAWFALPQADAPAWYRANSDPIVGAALRLLHNDPAHQWTVATLAAAVGVSRAALARRFTDLVGEPPMAYLTGWRLALAADMLTEPDATVGSVARKVGYGTPFALSTAFKRVRGVSPREHRDALSTVD
ncbi:AraC family transcriptional regulator [Herbihabitans rhizosphaerae]|nr:AraC family transcriptional regulator [Herbihabitans rhizosphaerae]